MLHRDFRRDIVQICKALDSKGWVANHDGNVTVRAGKDLFLATPTAYGKAQVGETDLLMVDGQGKRVSGRTRPFSELGLHLAVFQERPEVNAVIHAHPPHASGISVSGMGLDRPFLAEVVVSLGACIPTVPFAMPGARAEAALRPYIDGHDAVLMANHGVFTWGPDLETAYLRMELVEHVAHQAMVAQLTGGIRELPADVVQALLKKRRAAGLGISKKEGAPVAQSGGTHPAPSPQSSHVATISRSDSGKDLALIIGEEVARALKSS